MGADQQWLPKAWARALLLSLVIAGIASGAAVLGSTSSVATHRIALASLICGLAVGFVTAAIFVLHPARRAANNRATLMATLRAVARHDRDLRFNTILESGAGTELAEVAVACHDALISAHRDRLEAASLRREMDHRVEQQTRAAVAQLSRLSHTDELTTLLNRRGFEHALRQIWNETAPSGEELALLAIDLDHFKQLNDTCGHAKGDEALRAAGEIFRAHLRDGDFAARVGGDELFVVLRGVGAHTASSVARRFMTLFNSHPAGLGLPVPWPSMSIGVACAGEHGAKDPDDLKRKADSALYAAKHAGRNACHVFSPRAGQQSAQKPSTTTGARRSAA